MRKNFPNIKLNYKNQKEFTNTYDISYKKLTELSIHRPVQKSHLNFLIEPQSLNILLNGIQLPLWHNSNAW